MCDYLCLFKPHCFLPLWLKITVTERPTAGTASQHAGGEVSFHICESAEVYLGLSDVPAFFLNFFFYNGIHVDYTTTTPITHVLHYNDCTSVVSAAVCVHNKVKSPPVNPFWFAGRWPSSVNQTTFNWSLVKNPTPNLSFEEKQNI